MPPPQSGEGHIVFALVCKYIHTLCKTVSVSTTPPTVFDVAGIWRHNSPTVFDAAGILRCNFSYTVFESFVNLQHSSDMH